MKALQTEHARARQLSKSVRGAVFWRFLVALFPFCNAYGDCDTARDVPEQAELPTASASSFTFTDNFDRDNASQLGSKWLDCKSAAPSAFEPLGIYDGGVVVPDPFTRPGVYHLPPLSPYSTDSGRILHGIGCAFIETGTTTVSVSVGGSGNLGYGKTPPISHVESTPLLYITPNNSRFGFGAWISELYGHPVIYAGYIGNPPEKFEVIATARLDDGCSAGTPRTVELRAQAAGKVTVWVDGRQVAFDAGIGLAPLSVDPSMIHSTRHGFAVDAHLVDPPSNTKTLKSIESILIRGLD